MMKKAEMGRDEKRQMSADVCRFCAFADIFSRSGAPRHGMRFCGTKAQAIAEMAIFGSLFIFVFSLLLQYGLRYNYQQDVEMRAFRKALAIAYAGRDTYLDGNYTLIEDKPMPNLESIFSRRKRQTFVGSASVIWSNKMMTSLIPEDGQDMSRFMPRTYYEINGLKNYDQDSAGDRGLKYTTGGIVTYTMNTGAAADVTEIRIRVPDWGDDYQIGTEGKEAQGQDNIYWRWFTFRPEVLKDLAAVEDKDENGNSIYLPNLKNIKGLDFDWDGNTENDKIDYNGDGEADDLLSLDDRVDFIYTDAQGEQRAYNAQILKFNLDIEYLVIGGKITTTPVSCTITGFQVIDPGAGAISASPQQHVLNVNDFNSSSVSNDQLTRQKAQGSNTETVQARIGLDRQDKATKELITRFINKKEGVDTVTSEFRYNRSLEWKTSQ